MYSRLKSKVFRLNVVQYPPNLELRSKTNTFFLEAAKSPAIVRPPIPEPIIITLYFFIYIFLPGMLHRYDSSRNSYGQPEI